MKKILARVASVTLAIVMVLLAIPAMQAKADEETIKIHFKNTENWFSVSAYSWEGTVPLLGDWPGTDITSTKDGDYFTVEMKEYQGGSKLNIIFNMGSSERQTVDIKLDLTKGTEWWLVPNGEKDGKVTCIAATNKADADSGKGEVTGEFVPQAPANPTISKSPVIKGNKVTFYYECTNADKVQIAGSMNGWTMEDMAKNGNVYSYTCMVEPGTYQYKFIVNGDCWITDPKNPTVVQDNDGNSNSEFTVVGGGSTTPSAPVTPNPGTTVTSPIVKDGKVTFNYVSSTASKVEVFGNFNEWKSGIEMTKEDGVFTYTMELPNGEYEYKFVVDGDKWVTDPANSNQKNGNSAVTVTGGVDAPQKPEAPTFTPTITQSVVIDGNTVTIYYENPNVDKVEFMCSANEWKAVEMSKEGNVFSVTMELDKGDYQYKFLLNGDEWITDPLNTNEQIEGNSVFNVTTDKPVDEESEETEKTDTQKPVPSEKPDTQKPDAPADNDTPNNDGMIILIVVIVIIVVAAGGYVAYMLIKKKKAQ